MDRCGTSWRSTNPDAYYVEVVNSIQEVQLCHTRSMEILCIRLIRWIYSTIFPYTTFFRSWRIYIGLDIRLKTQFLHTFSSFLPSFDGILHDWGSGDAM